MSREEQGRELFDALVQNTLDAHWDMARCFCIVCTLGRMIGLAPGGPALQQGPSVPFEVPTLAVTKGGAE